MPSGAAVLRAREASAEVVLRVKTGLAHVTSRTKSLGSSVTASDCGDLRVLPADCSGTQALSTPKDSHGPMRSHIPAGQNKGETDMGGDLYLVGIAEPGGALTEGGPTGSAEPGDASWGGGPLALGRAERGGNCLG